jgi:hypothetical protein
MGAAEDLTLPLNPMSNDSGTTVSTGRRKSVDRTLKAVKRMRLALMRRHGKRFIVGVSTVFTLFHA